MMRHPVASVVMGVYNCALTLADSIRSILDQEFGDFEFIICDDGSTDATPDVLRAFAAKDPRIVLLRNERNMGLSCTLNRCIEASRGGYIARMDGDDIARSDRLRRQVAFLESRPDIDICGSSIALFDGSGVWGRIDYPEYPGASDFLLRSPFAHPTVVFRASAVKAAGGYACDPAVGRSEDYELFMRMYSRGVRGHNIQEYLLNYREELGSYRRRKFRYALTEARVRFRGFRRLGLLPRGLLYVVKPILVGLMPKRIYTAARTTAFGGGGAR
jgi:glycosyltransferase EpsE